jgi:AcrR family transcriptional regulator
MNYNEKKLSIIAAAETLFATKGYDGASVRDIANAADVNVAMISYYFGSKEKLMEAIFSLKTGQTRLKVENLIQDSELSSLEKMFRLIDDYVERFLDQQTFHKIIIREQVSESNSPITVFIRELKRKNLASINRLIAEGQKSGAFRNDIDVPMLMTTLVGTMSHTVTSKAFYREVSELEHLSDQEYVLHIKHRLSSHLKDLIKRLISNEN